ncbi:hypothetical protein H8356DRAFT_1348364 [Neocallimastix lanati (nom. inval.)]|nr:hypothetical protein H8356DRAFT_1348364 [Neocallimastix sp. JGI-2020a]
MMYNDLKLKAPDDDDDYVKLMYPRTVINKRLTKLLDEVKKKFANSKIQYQKEIKKLKHKIKINKSN